MAALGQVQDLHNRDDSGSTAVLTTNEDIRHHIIGFNGKRKQDPAARDHDSGVFSCGLQLDLSYQLYRSHRDNGVYLPPCTPMTHMISLHTVVVATAHSLCRLADDVDRLLQQPQTSESTSFCVVFWARHYRERGLGCVTDDVDCSHGISDVFAPNAIIPQALRLPIHVRRSLWTGRVIRVVLLGSTWRATSD